MGSVFDSTATSWTTTLFKQKSTPPLYFGTWTRDYWLQFHASGKAQKYRKTNGVVADTIFHQLLSGTGYFRTPRLVHHLISIGSNWVASNTNTDTVTINGTYTWAGIDTIVAAARKGRDLTRTITLKFDNVKGPRGVRLARSLKTSGTIEGTYTATVTLPGGATHTVTRTFTIVIGGGDATFTLDGTQFVADLDTGNH